MEYLDGSPLLEQEVGYGALGLNGELGYDGQSVRVRTQTYAHALSAHAPSRLVFDLEGQFTNLCCEVALNDDVAGYESSALFMILGDGRVLAMDRNVATGQAPMKLHADVRGVRRLELVTWTRHWEYCHTVWLDPRLDREAARPAPVFLADCLARTRMQVPHTPHQARRCIATVVSPGYTDMLEDMLGSLQANGQCPEAMVVVFAVNPDAECRRVIGKYGARTVECEALAPLNAMVKSVLYSVAQVVDADQFLCLDADTIVLGDLNPVFAALEACAEGSLLAAPDAFVGGGSRNLLDVLCGFYEGQADDLEFLLSTPQHEASYRLIVNDGVFAGGRKGLLALDQWLVGLLPLSTEWLERAPDHSARNQFLFNLALARLNCGVSLDETWNLLAGLHTTENREQEGRLEALWNGRAVRILHFAGSGRDQRREWAGRFAGSPPGPQVWGSVADPLTEHTDGDGCTENRRQARA
jgi:hypothetical protein